SDAGSDWSTWHVLDIDTGKELLDEIKWTKFTSAAWTKDSLGFFYMRFEEPKPGEEFTGLNFNARVQYHRIGTPQADDVVVYKRPAQPEERRAVELTEDERYLRIQTCRATGHNSLSGVRRQLDADAMPQRLHHSVKRVGAPRGNHVKLVFD